MQILELAAKLQSLGLNDKEAKVYVSSLFLGPASVQKIAEQADINRATAYVILDQLQEMGLVSESTEGKKTVFIAEGPEALERLFDRQKIQIEQRRAELKTLMSDLLDASRSEDDAPVVRFYKGLDGIRSINADSLRKSKPKTELYGFTNVDEVGKLFPNNVKTSPQARLKKKISSKVFYSSRSVTVPSDPKLLRQTIKLDEPVAADFSIYADRATLLSYKGEKSIGIVIESKEIVQALRQLFELAWKNNDK